MTQETLQPPRVHASVGQGVALKIGTLVDPSVYGGAQKAIFSAESHPFHLIAAGVPAFEGLPPRHRLIDAVPRISGPTASAASRYSLRSAAPRFS
jgi:hypothetical protein